MGSASVLDILRGMISVIAFRLFLWANRTTEDKYWREVYEIEKSHIERKTRSEKCRYCGEKFKVGPNIEFRVERTADRDPPARVAIWTLKPDGTCDFERPIHLCNRGVSVYPENKTGSPEFSTVQSFESSLEAELKESVLFNCTAEGSLTPFSDFPGCHAQKDGECNWADCPQIRDGEPARGGRHCPLDTDKDEED